MKQTITNIGDAETKGLSQLKKGAFSTQRLKDTISKARHKGVEITAHFTLNVGNTNPLQLLHQNIEHQSKTSFYWDQPDNQRSFLAGPPLQEIIPETKNHFSELSYRYRECEVSDISKIEQADYPDIPFWLGGLQFDATNSQEPLFHQSKFIIPGWILLNQENGTWLRIYIKITPFDSFKQVSKRLDRKIRKQIDILQAIPVDKPYIGNNYDIKAEPVDTSFEDVNDQKKYWNRAVEHIKNQIAEREIQKLVLARQLRLEINGERSSAEIMEYLRREYPECTNIMIRVDDETNFICSTPEHILTIDNRSFRTESLAGSSSRGNELVADQKNRFDLLSSSKNLHEHRIVRDDILCQLENHIKDITFPKTPSVKQLANVQHLFTPIEGTLINGADAFNLLAQLHPTPAVGGYPRYNINRMIKELEGFDRGWYASPVGWLDENGDAEFVVAIRCGYITSKKALLYAGCGIVRESDQEKEWDETNLKFRPLLHAIRQQ